ncbi:hypothetical protein Plav_2965 [Parvibaculum lavamentivorans DS-1]|uniref:Uncharacterized protein n=1 Tax=Parvibaculum lavamentivorans (strain DS-1 / DSM 13023 / NCIMB 13966) TaxID=402881 RepID=A7HXD9_PARL1|nr:hypothetical protein [Parvibaculum lavamentivorans]ABS64572.1 hypothetical protein Plav_2965 [Parvibaculum lavamentivorans DS-1]
MTSRSENGARPLPFLSRLIQRVGTSRLASYFLWLLVILCLVLGLADFAYHKHVEFPVEEFPAFYGLFALIGVFVLVVASKGLQVLLRRPENYYASKSVDAEPHPDFDLKRKTFDA